MNVQVLMEHYIKNEQAHGGYDLDTLASDVQYGQDRIGPQEFASCYSESQAIYNLRVVHP